MTINHKVKKSFILLAGVLVLVIFFFVGYSLQEVPDARVYVQEEFVAVADTWPSQVSDQREASEEITVVVPTVPVVQEPECTLLDDFTGDSSLRWYTVNDGVMGGLSDGFTSIQNNRLIHEGEIVTRGGGFSYVGTRLPADTLVGYSRLQVRLNTSGREYAANFADGRTWRVTHQVPIPVASGDSWQEVFIDFADTIPTVFSRQVNSAPFDASVVDELSFILSDGVDGPFRTEIDWIKVCI